MKIGFLFNHYAAHQVLHAAPIAFELSRRYPAAQVTVITVGAEIDAVVRRLTGRWPGQRCAVVRARVPRLVDWSDPLVRQGSDEQRGGQDGVSRCNTRWSPKTTK